MKYVRVFAPASVANVAVGFDILGFSFDALGDIVTLERTDSWSKKNPVVIKKIYGITDDLPLKSNLNTATVGLLKLHRDLKLPFGLEVSIHKGIPVGSGLGGSAASAVAAIFAANFFLDRPLTPIELINYAMEGEYVASGARHADNLAPCLLGGLQLISSLSPLRIVTLPIPKKIFCVLVHPQKILETKKSRKILKKTLFLKQHVRQSAHLGGFLAGCYQQDLELIQSSLIDILIEPQRTRLIPGFPTVQAVALAQGALGCSIAGSGPSVFAWAASESKAHSIQKAMVQAWQKLKVPTQTWMRPLSSLGARRMT